MKATIHLGYEVGTGQPVEIPLAHTFVTGQTQLSGKTTTLHAIVFRSGRPALAFVTKRGEQFAGRRIQPYLPREGEHPIHWRLVESILASALGQRAMKYERFWLIQAAKGATSLAGVRANVVRLMGKAKSGRTEEAYTLIREYLDLVLPDMKALAAADELQLEPGLNVMDLAGVGPQLQALVIRAALERINQHERGVLTVFPEAWEFAPRARAAPAKDEAIAMARKGAVLGNFLLCDSQDIAGVDTVIRQAASVWILGVQRELNELKRTIDSIPAGVAKPKSSEVATLERGQFFACWGRHAIKTYVQPDWLDERIARQIAIGALSIDAATPPRTTPRKEDRVSPHEAEQLRNENAALRQRITDLEGELGRRQPAAIPAATPSSNGTIDEEQLYQRVLARLLQEPAVLRLAVSKPELQVETTREVINADAKTLRGRLALLLSKGYFDDPKAGNAAYNELQRLGFSTAKPNVYRECDKLAEMGFLTKESSGYQAAPGMKVNVVEK